MTQNVVVRNAMKYVIVFKKRDHFSTKIISELSMSSKKTFWELQNSL